jgi:hypothetical protein
MSVTSYLDRLLDPVTEAFTPEIARKIADLRADEELESHIDEPLQDGIRVLVVVHGRRHIPAVFRETLRFHRN